MSPSPNELIVNVLLYNVLKEEVYEISLNPYGYFPHSPFSTSLFLQAVDSLVPATA
jgi:hypothetical protein